MGVVCQLCCVPKCRNYFAAVQQNLFVNVEEVFFAEEAGLNHVVVCAEGCAFLCELAVIAAKNCTTCVVKELALPSHSPIDELAVARWHVPIWLSCTTLTAYSAGVDSTCQSARGVWRRNNLISLIVEIPRLPRDCARPLRCGRVFVIVCVKRAQRHAQDAVTDVSNDVRLQGVRL